MLLIRNNFSNYQAPADAELHIRKSLNLKLLRLLGNAQRLK